jgi:hypothetical protein
VAGERAELFLLSGHDDAAGVFTNMALPPAGRKPFSFSSAVLVIFGVVGGSSAAIALAALIDVPVLQRPEAEWRPHPGRRLASIRRLPARSERGGARAYVPVAGPEISRAPIGGND